MSVNFLPLERPFHFLVPAEVPPWTISIFSVAGIGKSWIPWSHQHHRFLALETHLAVRFVTCNRILYKPSSNQTLLWTLTSSRLLVIAIMEVRLRKLLQVIGGAFAVVWSVNTIFLMCIDTNCSFLSMQDEKSRKEAKKQHEAVN